MALSKTQKLAILVAIPVLFFLIPAPEGLSLIAWRLLGIYIATIVGLVIKQLLQHPQQRSVIPQVLKN